MSINLIYQIVTLGIIGILFYFLARYVMNIFAENTYRPVSWTIKRKKGEISGKLKYIERFYADKVRFYNFWFQIERIKKEQIQGSFAELGVYKGETAKIIHWMAPEKKFHLFDTFEGFKEKDLQEESGKAATYTEVNFADTNIEKVRRKIQGNDNVIIHKGYFPETTKDLENEQYALVNIDADLYNPIKSGLDYFYPRLSPGGVLIVHDYNPDWEGAMKAVDEFKARIPEIPIPLPDMNTSVMIVKNK
ncbi:TylF/MycF/NovP-related O-methyltransferase [Bacteroidota bacterium]